MAEDATPQIRTPGKGKKFLVYVLGGIIVLLVLILVLPSPDTTASATPIKNVTVGGWNFSARLSDEWRADPSCEVEQFNDWSDCHSDEAYYWSGMSINKPFFIPKGPTERHYSGMGGKSGFIDIEVLQIPKELNNLPLADVLTGAADSAHCYTVGEGSDEALTFNGRNAHLWTQDESLDGKEYSIGIIAVELDMSQVAIIEVERWDESETSAEDVIDSFTIGPAR